MEYRIIDYGWMIADDVRMNAYARALESTITRGDVVLEIGTGPGLMALLAWRLGAKRVVAVECDDVIQVARQVAEASGASDRLEFIHGRSTDLEMSPRADVIVSDLRGVLPLHTGHLRSIVDARERLLAPDGVLIPRQDCLFAAVVEAPSSYKHRVECWSDSSRGFDLAPARELAVNTWWKERVEPNQLLTDQSRVATLDYGTIEDATVTGVVTVEVRRAGTAHGLSVWFDTELAEGVGFSNAPDQPETIYGSGFFPLSEPVEVTVGDVIKVDLRAIPTGTYYVWAWGTRFERAGAQIREFRQSTALGMPLTREQLALSSPRATPILTVEGQRTKLALEMMCGVQTVEEIAAAVSERFPGEPDTLERVVALATKYGRV